MSAFGRSGQQRTGLRSSGIRSVHSAFMLASRLGPPKPGLGRGGTSATACAAAPSPLRHCDAFWPHIGGIDSGSGDGLSASALRLWISCVWALFFHTPISAEKASRARERGGPHVIVV